MTKRLIYLFCLASCVQGHGQSVIFSDDSKDRGYTARPYLRYEAEEGRCVVSGVEFLRLSAENYTHSSLASEASNLQAAQLTEKGSRVSWHLDSDADALTIRFSLPDTPDGKGTRQELAIYNGDRYLCSVTLDSYWAWQYTVSTNVSEKYPDNIPASGKFARMRFDEARVLLPGIVPAGSELRLERVTPGSDAMTIDFMEAELAGEPQKAPQGAVVFEGVGSGLQAFVNKNPGKTIYLPAGKYDISNTLTINADGTKLVGAGMWHTQLYFTASPDNERTYSRRGVKCSSNECGLSGMWINTANNQRYFKNNPVNQAGKGLMGSWGKNSEIKDVLVEHFECGAWIADYEGNSSRGLKVTGCRFRNNYADGINLCSGTEDATVSQCSFRNNGDDDMASWSTGNGTRGNLFDHCTAENNWRASSLGFFGGCDNGASNIAIYDGMECGIRINADFDGTGFSKEGRTRIENASISRCGTESGRCGESGDFWGNAQPALMVSAGYFYDVDNAELSDIDIYDCRFEGVRVKSGSGKKVNNLKLKEITVHNQWNQGKAFDFVPGLRGNGEGAGLGAEGCAEPWISDIPSTFDFNLSSGLVENVVSKKGRINVSVRGNNVYVEPDTDGDKVCFFNSSGIMVRSVERDSCVSGLVPGVYVLSAGNCAPCKIIVF